MCNLLNVIPYPKYRVFRGISSFVSSNRLFYLCIVDRNKTSEEYFPDDRSWCFLIMKEKSGGKNKKF